MAKKKIEVIKLEDSVYDLAIAIRELLEDRCGNEGWNWYDKFMRNYGEVLLRRYSPIQAQTWVIPLPLFSKIDWSATTSGK